MNEYEDFALGSYLCDWPEDTTFIEILEMLKSDAIDDISIWEPFENHDGAFVAEQITNMLDSVESRFIPKPKEVIT